MRIAHRIGVFLTVTLLYASHVPPTVATFSDDVQDLSRINLTNLADNTLFTRWRPTFHFASPNSWMNDPCGPYYNPMTQTYHLYYQAHPGSVQWGNISWGHGKSKDMIFWEDVTSWQADHYVALAPGVGNNQSELGVFTGAILPVSTNGDTTGGTVTVIYTSVKHLPISWNGHYQVGSETQSLAVSYDDGITYQHYPNNPIIVSPPEGWNITGWRDPKFEQWPEMDLLLYGSNRDNYYMTISSGIRGVGPRLLLYQASPNNLIDWTFLGPLISVAGNYTVNEEWSGSLGYNFEVSNTFSLREKDADGGDNQTVHIYTSIGTEGGNTSLHPSNHWSVWVEGTLTKTSDGTPNIDIFAGGVADWGDAYAFNSFYDPVQDRRIFYGWLPEAHNSYGERAFGYNGQITLSREVFVQVIRNVVDVDKSLSKAGAWTMTPNNNGTYTFKTLGVRPIEETTKLRRDSTLIQRTSQTFDQMTSFTSLNVSSSNFELTAHINISSNRTAGFVFRRSSNGLEYTTLIYDPRSQYLIVDRTHSSLIPHFQNRTILAKHALLTTVLDGNMPQKELLSIRIFVDHSLVEVYANNRTVISTHIYPALADSTGIGYVVGGQTGTVAFSDISIWSNLQNAFPLRPRNSSVALVNTPDPVTSTTLSPTTTNAAALTFNVCLYSLINTMVLFLFTFCIC